MSQNPYEAPNGVVKPMLLGLLFLPFLVPALVLAGLMSAVRLILYPDRRAHFYWDKGDPEFERANKWLSTYSKKPWAVRITRIVRKRRLLRAFRQTKLAGTPCTH